MIFEDKILNIYKGLAFVRCDGDGTAYYFSAEDFSGLCAAPYEFASSQGHTLKGYFYQYPDERKQDGRLIVFDHGFGGGHRSYMREIELLCSRGYLVFAYDHTGCMESGGESTHGMAQSLCDLDDCLHALGTIPQLKEMRITVIGHSWGGFSTLNISSLHREVEKIVAISGFASVERLVRSYFSGPLAIYRSAIMRLEREANPSLVDIDALRTLGESDVKALLIYSADDPVCKKKYSYDAFYERYAACDRIKFILESDKGHNPNYTADAVRYLGEYTKERKQLIKRGMLSTEEQKREFISHLDWRRMTEQDPCVWTQIFNFIEE